MSLTDQQYEQIHAYLQGKLTDQENAEIAQLIQTNPDYAKAVATERILLLAIEEDAKRELKKKLSLIHNEAFDKQPPITANSPARRLWWYAAASVLVILGVGGLFWIFNNPIGDTEAPPTAAVETPTIDTTYQISNKTKTEEDNLGYAPNVTPRNTIFQLATNNEQSIQYRYQNDTLYLQGNISASQIQGILNYQQGDFVADYLQMNNNFYQLFSTDSLHILRMEQDSTILRDLRK